MAVRDVILISVIIFTLAIGFFILHFTLTKTIDEIVLNPDINQSALAKNSFLSGKEVINKMDYLIFMVFIGMILALIITAWFVGGLPIFMFIYFLILVIGVVISAILSNIWESVSTNGALAGTLSYFPITNHILLNFPIYISIIGFIGIVVMFGKPFFASESEI